MTLKPDRKNWHVAREQIYIHTDIEYENRGHHFMGYFFKLSSMSGPTSIQHDCQAYSSSAIVPVTHGFGDI